MGWGLSVPKAPPRPHSLLHGVFSSPGRSGTQAQAYWGQGARESWILPRGHISKHCCLDYGFWGVGEARTCLEGGPPPAPSAAGDPTPRRSWAGGNERGLLRARPPHCPAGRPAAVRCGRRGPDVAAAAQLGTISHGTCSAAPHALPVSGLPLSLSPPL